MMTLIIMENIPRVSILIGKLIMLNIGFNTSVNNIRKKPPIRYVKNPSVTDNAGRIYAVKNKATLKISVLRTSDFICRLDTIK